MLFLTLRGYLKESEPPYQAQLGKKNLMKLNFPKLADCPKTLLRNEYNMIKLQKIFNNINE